MSRAVVALAVVALSAAAGAQPSSARRLTTISGLRQFPGFYHLQNVLVRGELIESEGRLVLRANDVEMRAMLNEGVRGAEGPVEVRGQLFDIGRLEPGDPRAGTVADGRDADRWPRPGEELLLRIGAVSEAPTATVPSIRTMALEPWKFDAQKVTVIGNFRGRNLFGELPGAPGKSRYDFVLRGAEGAIWVTGIRPRGRGFDLDVDRRVDSDRWVQVTGTVTEERGLVLLEATAIAAAKAPEITAAPEEPEAPPPPPPPVEVVFSSPLDGETDVSRNAPVRIQFSRGLNEKSLPDQFRVTYLGSPEPGAPPQPDLQVRLSYDAASRSVELRFSEPLAPFRTVRVEIRDGVKAFDGGAVTPWTLTFSVGG